MKKGEKATKEVIEKAHKLWARGDKIADIAKEVGVTNQTIYTWVEKGFDVGARKRDRLQQKFLKLYQEQDKSFNEACELVGVTSCCVEVWRKAGEITFHKKKARSRTEYPKEVIEKAKELYEGGASVRDICRELGLQTGLVYAWQRRLGWKKHV